MQDFINSGRFVCRSAYIEKKTGKVLKDDCTDVVEYFGGHIIQVLKSGEFYVDESYSSDSLDKSEIILWENINKQLNGV